MTWYHGTDAVLAPGDILVPGCELGKANFVYGDLGNDSFVWLTTRLHEAAEYGAIVYEVEPIGTPEDYVEMNGWDDCEYDEWIVGRATIVRSVAVKCLDKP